MSELTVGEMVKEVEEKAKIRYIVIDDRGSIYWNWRPVENEYVTKVVLDWNDDAYDALYNFAKGRAEDLHQEICEMAYKHIESNWFKGCIHFFMSDNMPPVDLYDVDSEVNDRFSKISRATFAIDSYATIDDDLSVSEY